MNDNYIGLTGPYAVTNDTLDRLWIADTRIPPMKRVQGPYTSAKRAIEDCQRANWAWRDAQEAAARARAA